MDPADSRARADDGGPETRLAVYGTLRPGEANHHMLADLPGTWERGTVRGRLHRTGWGMTFGFPALIWDPGAPPVPVQVLTSRELPAHWARLDAFEGNAYRRVVVPVRIGADSVLANVYVLRQPG
jgi:gamma-glutamylcyclotransferase (GGCT)/AIG2-like uncharacterized protein YtfP